MTPKTGLVLFDTNILVHVLRASSLGKRAAADAEQLNSTERPLISVVTIGEIKSLATQWSWGPKKMASLDELLRELVVVNIHSNPIINRYAELDSWSISQGHRMEKNDVWIAATVSVTGAMLMTTDQDFDHLHQVHLSRTLYEADGSLR